jgi:general secretion pathway protein D
MMARKQLSLRKYSTIFVFAATFFLLISNCLFATEQASTSEETPFGIFPLKYISVEQGRNYLAELGIGTVSRIPGSAALLVTAQPGELTKVKAILNLVDGPEPFIIKQINTASTNKTISSNKQIALKVGDISIGNFSDPPAEQANAKAIIDIYNDALIVIAPVSLSETIVAAIEEVPVEDVSKTFAKQKISSNLLAYPKLTNSTILNTTELVAPDEQEQKIPEPSPDEQSKEPQFLANGDETVNLALAEHQKLTIAEFLGLVGPYLQLDFMYNEQDLIGVGEVTFNPHGKFRGPIKVKELYSLLESVLKFRNLVMTRGKGNLVTIAPLANALEIDPTLLEDDVDKIENGDGVVTRIFELEYISSSSAINLLEAMKLYAAPPIPEGKSIIVTAYAEQMARIARLLDIVDKPGEPKKFRFRQLRYTMSQTLAPKVQTLAEQLGTISITIGDVETSAEPTVSPKRPNENDAQYRLRLRREQQAAQRRAAATARTARTAPEEESIQPTVYLDADERTNRILMIGLQEQLDTVEELIDTLDVAQQDPRSLQLYKIEHVDAEDVKRKLEELGIIGPSTESPTSSMRISDDAGTASTPAQARPRNISTRTRSEEETPEALLEEPQVVIIEATNSLLVNATEEQHARIDTIISFVDSETELEEIPYRVYQLKNQGPEHVREVLLPFIEETIETARGEDDKIQETRTRKRQEELIEIVADPNTSSLIVYANKKHQEWIGSLIDKLDKRRPQVLIDVTLVQISKTDAFNYDLNLLSSFPDLTNVSGVTSSIIDIAADANSIITNFFPDRGRDHYVDFQSYPKAGVGTGFYGDKHINFLLTAMQEKNYGRIMAKPKILVNDNEEGIISTTDKTYVEKTTGTVIEGVTNAVQTSKDYQDYDAGITLSIIPHISESELLRLDINLTRSDFDLASKTGLKPPDTTESNVETTVTVPDGSTIILGGMLKLNQGKGGYKIPLLGDIPLLGGLFRSTSNSDIQRNLYVFVKAEIIRPVETGLAQADLQRISQRNRTAFEQHELEFQKYHDWPGAKPQPMEPLRVLDAQ